MNGIKNDSHFGCLKSDGHECDIRVTRSRRVFIHVDVQHYPFNNFKLIPSLVSRSTNKLCVVGGVAVAVAADTAAVDDDGDDDDDDGVDALALSASHRECQQFNLGK